MKVKDLMTPVSEYKTIKKSAQLGELVVSLADGKHRDILVTDDDDKFVGILTMTDILMALEPNYKNLKKKDLASDILSNRFVADLFKEFDLWSDALANICKKGCNVIIEDAMYAPSEEECLNEDSDLEQAIHQYIVGTHQPVIVRSNGDIVGVLRMADVFEEIIKRMSACACEQ